MPRVPGSGYDCIAMTLSLFVSVLLFLLSFTNNESLSTSILPSLLVYVCVRVRVRESVCVFVA